MPRQRPCIGPNCPTRALTTHHTSRCPQCRTTHEHHRGTTQQRGYGTHHQQLRTQWQPTIDAGQATCWRCQQPIHPGQPWDLGHDDHDRTKYRGPEHALAKDCKSGGNRATSGRNRKGHADTTKSAFESQCRKFYW